MNCDSRLLHAKDVAEALKEEVETVKLSTLLSKSDKLVAGNFAVLLVNVPTETGETQLFRATVNSNVPTNTDVIRNSTGQLVGIPAVAGG